MSKFADKLKAGTSPTNEDWNEYLIEFHRVHTQATSSALTQFHTNSGQTPYAVLADEAETLTHSAPVILDLGCGDGVLTPLLLKKIGAGGAVIGTDFSREELDIAECNNKDPRASFLCANAQALPVPDGSFDLIVSHMAFMLMLPLEPVISEISRTLKKGGTFTAIMGHSSFAKGLWAEIVKLTSNFITSRYPGTKTFAIGNNRLFTNNGLKSLFTRDSGFDSLSELIELEALRRLDPDDVWELIRYQYLTAMMTAKEQAELETEIKNLVSPRLEKDGRFLSCFPLRMFRVSKKR